MTGEATYGSRLAGGLGSELLTGRLATGGLAGGLLGAGHDADGWWWWLGWRLVCVCG